MLSRTSVVATVVVLLSRDGCPFDKFNELVKASTSGTYLPEQSDNTFRCGISRIDNSKVTFIIGGTDSELQEFPFAALLVSNFYFPG